MARMRATNDDHGAPVTSNRSGKLYRPLIMANHILHWISAVIVMSISAYFIHNYSQNTHLVYWVSVAAVDALLYIPATILPALKRYKGHGAPLAWIFSYLWLTAFIFTAQDYKSGSCALRSPAFVNKCSLKKTIEAFAFLAFFTNFVGTALEARLYDVNRNSGAVGEDKHTVGSGAIPVATTPPHTAV